MANPAGAHFEESKLLYCKDYHQAKTASESGSLRGKYQAKSTCPAWASDPLIQEALLQEALLDTGNAKDALGRPKKIWNALENFVFVGVSCNLRTPTYNCYPEKPPDGRLLRELERRASRTLVGFLAMLSDNDG